MFDKMRHTIIMVHCKDAFRRCVLQSLENNGVSQDFGTYIMILSHRLWGVAEREEDWRMKAIIVEKSLPRTNYWIVTRWLLPNPSEIKPQL
jgi:hypothetical protein